ncbi:hypothetical protein ACTOVN_05630 [Arcanobacterium canis]
MSTNLPNASSLLLDAIDEAAGIIESGDIVDQHDDRFCHSSC